MDKQVIVETSARHVHVSREDLDVLFGKGHKLTPKKDLSQPGQFACEERVCVSGPRGDFPYVSILGPVRPVSQVELSASDARSIGVKAPVRESGDIAGTPGCTLIGPKGGVDLEEGVIVAKRHIHMTPADAELYSLADKQVVSVAVRTEERSLTYGDVVVRVNKDFALAMHVDTDESNAAGLAPGSVGCILT